MPASRFELGCRHCQKALYLYRRHNDFNGEADTLDSLGYIDHHTGHHNRAIDHYQHALTIYRDLGSTSQIAITLTGIGRPYAALGQYEQARVVWREALRLYREQGRDEDAARVKRQLDDLDLPDDKDFTNDQL